MKKVDVNDVFIREVKLERDTYQLFNVNSKPEKLHGKPSVISKIRP